MVKLLDYLDTIYINNFALITDDIDNFICLIYIDKDRKYRDTLSSYLLGCIVHSYSTGVYNFIAKEKDQYNIDCIQIRLLGHNYK